MFNDLAIMGGIVLAGIFIGLPILAWLCGIRYIPHNKVGVVEKLWSASGSLKGGAIISRDGKAGFQVNILRGGIHFGYYPWQYRIHKEPLVMVSESRIGYVYARDGEPLPPVQTLGRAIECNSFQDAQAFLGGSGQRGRQRAILREGVYAINQALFVVITEDRVYSGPIKEREDFKYSDWQAQLKTVSGFRPVIVWARDTERKIESGCVDSVDVGTDSLGVVTVHDGTPIESGEIIAPEVTAPPGVRDHQYFQDPEAFLELGGRRGKQLQVLTDGTYFINRWFATVEMRPKTVIPIGYVGVVVSYYGFMGDDVSGTQFRYGEQVEPGHRGVWKNALPPGKYTLNPFAVKIELVPTVNFVLRWITGQSEQHKYDEDLRSIALITADGYEPEMPLSLVLHIDYEKAPSVIQRFGDVKRLISQTLDPILSSYFRDVAQSSHMLDLLMKRDDIQRRATEELGRRFKDYDINCIAVLIGRPETRHDPKKQGEDPIERLFNQLRMRRLAEEQIETFTRQEQAAHKLRELNNAQAAAEKQMELTQTKIGIEIAGNKGEAQLAEAQSLIKRDVAVAEGQSRSKVLLAEGESRATELIGKGEAARISQTGLSEAAVMLEKVKAYGDPRLLALKTLGEQFSKSSQPLVPERVFNMGGGKEGENNSGGGQSVLAQFITLLMADKAGMGLDADKNGRSRLENYSAEMKKKYNNEIQTATDAVRFEGTGLQNKK